MDRKGKLCTVLLLLAVLLGAVGCGSPDAPPSGAVSEAESSRLAEESSSGTVTAAAEISLLSDGRLEVGSGIRFLLPDGWEEQEASVPGELLSVASPDGHSRVSAVRSELPAMTGVTADLLIEEMRESLATAWKEAGAEAVEAAGETVRFLGGEVSALSLTATMDGQPVFQKQLYLLDGDGLLTLTVTTRGTDDTQACLDRFSEG